MEITGIKYKGPIFDQSGYGQACRGNILSLHKLGIPITLELLSFEQSHPDLGRHKEVLGGFVNKDIDTFTIAPLIVLNAPTPRRIIQFQINVLNNFSLSFLKAY